MSIASGQDWRHGLNEVLRIDFSKPCFQKFAQTRIVGGLDGQLGREPEARAMTCLGVLVDIYEVGKARMAIINRIVGYSVRRGCLEP